MLVVVFGVNGVRAQSYTSTSAATAWNASRWNSTDAAPYTSVYTANSAVSFTSGTYTFAGMGATTNVGNVTVASGVTVNFASIGSTFATNGAVRTFDIGSGGLFDFNGQTISTTAGTGFIKTGYGVFATGGGAFTGGFTLDAGTVIAKGTTGLGSGAGNTLTLNGGTVASNATRIFDNTRFPVGITIGGNVQFGEMSTVVSLANSTANLSFANNVSLGSSLRTLTLGNGGITTFSGVISGSGGLIFAANANGTGKFVLTGVNTYTGNTTISSGRLALSGSGSIATSPIITVGSAANFDISGRSAALTLATGQSLRSSATGSNSTATVTMGTTPTLTLSAGGLGFTEYGGGATAPMTVAGAGSLALASSPVTVTTTTALGVGTYKLIAKSESATVTGTPGTLIMAGSVLAANTSGALSVSGGELILTVSSSASSSSNIILNSGFTHPTNIDYTAYQAVSGLTTGNSIEVGQFDIQDGGGSADADAIGTTLTAISLTVANYGNIRSLALFDGSTNVAEISSVTSTSSFSSLTLEALDDASKTFSIRATFKNTVTDNQQISFTVSSATASSSGSSFAAANAGAAATTTAGDNNRIEVSTSAVIFDQNVSSVSQNAVMNPSPTVLAVDNNANFDLDNTSNVVMTISTGLATFGSATTTVAMVAGIATFTNLVFATAANTNQLTATQGAFTDVSANFNVTASSPEINVKQGITSLFSGSGTYAAGNIVSGNSGSPVTFTIENIGSANLTYSSITNSNTSDFTLDLINTSSPISASGTTTFTLSFNPSTAGAKSTTITINNNDLDEGTYTFTVTGTGTVSTASDVLSNSGYSYSSNINYASYQSVSTLTTGNSVGVNGLTIRDGGASADADNLGTTLTGLTFTTGGSTAIRTAALFDGSTNIAEVPVNGASTISFTGLSLNAADGGTKDFELRVSYQSTVTDNQQLTFTISSASASTAYSGFAAANAGAAISSATNDINKLEVTATVLAFVQQVGNVLVNSVMIPAPTVSANDANGNRDLDYLTDMTATTTGTFAVASTNTVTPIAGLGTFSNLQFSSVGTGYTIDISSGSITNTGNSSNFNIYDAQPTIQAANITFTNVGMNSMTINWTNGNGTNRMVVVKASGAPGTPSDGQTYTANTIFGSGSTFGTSEYVVYIGAGNTVDITGLTASITYSVKVFEYNGSAGTENYLTTSNNTSQTTAALTYYSNGSGDPALLASWNTLRNGSGSNPTNFTSGEIFIIESSDVMTTTSTWAISGTNSKLQIESGGTLTANHAITLTNATTFQIDNGGIYNHNNTGSLTSTIFAGTEVFGASSNFIINNTPSFTAPSAPGYGNLTINTSTNATSVGLSSTLTQVQGNLTFTSTGTGAIRYALLGTGSTTLNIGGNLSLNGTTALFYFSSGTGTASVTVAGDVIVSSGTLDMSNSGSGGAGTLNIGGNFNQTGGTIKSTSSNPSTINFTGSGKTFTKSGGTLTNANINWNIADGASLTLVNDLPVASGRTLTVGGGTSGILDCSTLAVTGAGAFTLSAGATLKTASATGVAGAIIVSGTKTFSSLANYEFNGADTGTFTTTPAANTVNDLTINKSSGVVILNQSLKTNGALTLTSGTLDIGSNTLTIAGSVSRTNGNIDADAGTLSFDNTNNLSLPTSLFSGNIYNLSKAGGAGTVTLNDNLTVTNLLTNTASVLSVNTGALIIATSKELTVSGTGKATINGTLTNNGTFTLNSGATLLQGDLSSISGGAYNVKQTVTGSGGSTPNGRFWYLGPALSNATSTALLISNGNQLWQWNESSFNYAAVSTGQALTQGKSYVLRSGQTTETINFSGTSLSNGTVNVTGLSRTGTTQTYRGCHLISNPYPSYLDWNAITKTNIGTTMYIRTAIGTTLDVMETFNSVNSLATTISSVPLTQYIAPMQGFWVKVTTDGQEGSLSMTNAMRSHQNGSGLRSTPQDFPAFLRFNMLDGQNKDQIILFMTPNATSGIDSHDSEKMSASGYAQFYSTVNAKKLVINGMKNVKAKTSVPLTLEMPSSKSYTFQAEEFNIEDGLILLEDKQEGVIQDLTINPTYSFFGNVGTNATRFVVHFQLANAPILVGGPMELESLGSDELTTENIQIISNNQGTVIIRLDEGFKPEGSIRIFDASGRLVEQGNFNDQETTIQLNEQAGMYFVEVNAGKLMVKRKIVIN
jgi:hypothetical protein